ncbi:bifunctional diguanylate cyclase/phosphodiesterase [Streptomyces sp. NP160]|uniref:putative bifunctional diguanylate cyclase/phosphodiesterase n=1 Tax=Streptomyces sp. NP160 TaxID=2586637 RepID=UPI00111B43C5|nr:bifunctional diguanylate cyclase/phosphodiesterase [Streptomyces sp. NP160]TNM69701.1 bifunctional diguanylate cyclase/phosphodiesterase [Streptomyces sp. NP160]
MEHQPPRRGLARARGTARRLTTPPSTASPVAAASLAQVLLCVSAVLALVVGGLPGHPEALVAVLNASGLLGLGLALVVRCRGQLGAVGLHVLLVGVSLGASAAALAASASHASTAFMVWYCAVVAVAVAASSWSGAVAHVALAVVSAALLHLERGTGSPTAVLVVGCALVLTVVVTGRAVHSAGDAGVDGLTRLPTRRAFEQRLSSALEKAQAQANAGEQAPLVSVLLLDLDHFEVVNRTHGRDGGDDALRTAAGQLRAALPSDAACARLEGDRFAVLLVRRDDAAVPTLARDLQRAIAPLQASVGAAHAEAEQDYTTLLRRAEVALHAAKEAGRDCLRTADSYDEQLVRGLRRALLNPSIQVALQPLVDPATERVLGVEALARWHDPARGWVPPAVFIPVAEKNGLIPDLGQVVLERACRDALQLVHHLGRPLTLTVNASGAELVRPQYVDDVAAVLHRTQWPARDLVVEVTESSLDAASQDTLATVEQLKQLGVRVAIDDFGTGYSAFSQLDNIPAEFLKLDTSFTATTTTSTRRQAMLAALVTLCGELGIQVIAEGVETAEQAELVARFGCDLAQGYHYARPMLVADLIAELARRSAPGHPVHPAPALQDHALGS